MTPKYTTTTSRPSASVLRAVVLPAALTAIALPGLRAAGLSAQDGSTTARERTEVRTIQPRYTRIIESDTLGMWAPDLSPDGRWVVFTGRGEGENSGNLWIVSAEGGTPVRLTSGRFLDLWARWSPTGDRIAFLSDRPSRVGPDEQYVMTIPMDPQTGRATGPLRQVTLRRAFGLVAFSPDGAWIAYLSRPQDPIREMAGRLIMVVPSTGGTAREVATLSGQTGWPFLQWSADGRYVYYSSVGPGSGMHHVMRVPIDGGAPQDLSTVRPRVLHVDPSGRYMLRRIDVPERGGTPPDVVPNHEILTTDGRVLARFGARTGMWVWRFTPDARGAIAQQWHGVGPIRAVPVAGGPIRQVTDGRTYHWPFGWSPDGLRVFAVGQVDGQQVILEAPLDGRAAREWQVPAGARHITLSRDAQFLWYTLETDDPEVDRVLVRRLGEGEPREVSSEHFNVHTAQTSAVGPGGVLEGDEYYFFKRHQDHLELWAAAAEGAPRLLHAFPMSFLGHTHFGVHGNRIAYTERRGDSTALFVVEGRNGRPREVATVAGKLSEPVWSHDGRWIAGHHYAPGDSAGYDVFAIGVNPDGTPSGPPKIVRTEKGWGWLIQWLPDDRALTVLCGSGGGATGVWLVSLRDGDRPVELTRDETAPLWGYRLSPDGRHVVYPAEVARGTSLWRLDLSAAYATTEQPRR